MEGVFAVAALWIALALASTFLASLFRISTALVEIVVGIAAAAVAAQFFAPDALGSERPWLAFVAATGSVVLTFLAGAELNPIVLRSK
jgi:Kef-type K+ transport system membrane component KefB